MPRKKIVGETKEITKEAINKNTKDVVGIAVSLSESPVMPHEPQVGDEIGVVEKVPTKKEDGVERLVESQKKPALFPGWPFTYNGMRFIILEERRDGILAISEEIVGKMRFSDGNGPDSNNWKKSHVRKKLNTEYIKKFDTNDLMHVVSDLTADTGETNYGVSDDYIALPTDFIFRKFHQIIPSYGTWVWSATPWSVEYSQMSAVSARTGAKTIYSEQPNRELGVAIVCVFKKEVVSL